NLVHDQLRRAVHAVDFPQAVTVVSHVGAAVFRAIADFVQSKGLEHAQPDFVLDQLAGLVEDLHVRLVDAFRRKAESVARNRDPDVVVLVDRDRRDRVQAGRKYAHLIASWNLDLARIRLDWRARRPLPGRAAWLCHCTILPERGSRDASQSQCEYCRVCWYFHFLSSSVGTPLRLAVPLTHQLLLDPA